jgi:hypothetical protein
MAADNNGLSWYRVLLKLYPKAYRQEYQEEMLITFREMLSSVESPSERRQLFLRTLKDYFLSLTQQSWLATETSFNGAPGYVKRNVSVASCLVAPFFIVFMYNITSLRLLHAVILSNLEAKTWVIYSIILPLLGFLLSVTTCLSGVYGQLLRREWHKAIDTTLHDWLFLGVPVGILALVAIF